MKVCTLQPLLINIILGTVIPLRYDNFLYTRSSDKNFLTYYSLLIADTVVGWGVYFFTFKKLILNYEYFRLARQGWCFNDGGDAI